MKDRETCVHTQSYRLDRAELFEATFRDAEERNRAAEEESFRFFKRGGHFWTPTREMLVDHIWCDTETRAHFRTQICNIHIALCLEGAAIVALCVTLLLR